MKNRRNYYRILHVQPDAPSEIIRTSYRTLMHGLRMHPDLGGDQWNAALINEAFATLSDPEKRADYDKSLKMPRDRQRDQTRPTLSLPQGEPEPVTARNLDCAFCGARQLAREADLAESTCYCCESPLFPAPRHEGVAATWRLLARMPRHMRVTCSEASRPDRSFEVTTEDVSVSGMRVTSPCELSPGQRLKIHCSFADAVGVVIHVAAKSVAWQRRWHAGVHFLTLRIKQIRGVFLSTEG